jgi:hypothetical protein
MNCLTLLSDLGLHDPGVAVTKGILMQHLPETRLLDVSHSIEPFHLEQAAYMLRVSYRHFAPGTCHVVLFNVFSERSPRLVYCEFDGYHFLAPDNGVLPLALRQVPDALQCYQAPHPGIFHEWLHGLGRTAALVKSGSIKDESGVTSCHLKVAPQAPPPPADAKSVECHVIHIDRFENVVLDITKEQFERLSEGRSFRIRFMRNDEISTVSHNYYEVRDGEKLCRFNSAGHLEICINRGKAASLFGFRLHREQHLLYRSIKILFGS